MSSENNENAAKNETTSPVRDLDAREHFDRNGEVKDDEMAKFYADEREKLLGDPVGSNPQGYIDAPPPAENFEKADGDAKVELMEGDTPESIAARYSKKQLAAYAKDNEIETLSKDTAAILAEKIIGFQTKKVSDDPANDLKAENSYTVAPAASDVHKADIETDADAASDADKTE